MHIYIYIYIYLYITATNLTKMVTKKGVTIIMTVGLVPLLICFIGLFPYSFNVVYQVDYK